MNALSIVALVMIVGLMTFFWVRGFLMTYALIVTNVVIFGVTLASDASSSSRLVPIIEDLAFRPIYLDGPEWSRLHTVLSAGFLHGGWMHLFGNMLILLLAGVPFEERLGRARFLGLYLFTVVVASLAHALWVDATDPGGVSIPSLGASGGVFGILGGFAAAYPRDKFPIFPIPLGFFSIFMRDVPVVIAVVLLSVLQGFSLFVAGNPGVAYAAHLGGAAAGCVAGIVLRRSRPPSQAPEPKRIDFGTLQRLSHDDRTRMLVSRVQENSDSADLQRAWLDRLLVNLRCPQCGEGYAETRGGMLECENGHKERYLV